MILHLSKVRKIGILGVGESTIPQLGDFFKEMGIEERDWMASSNSIYKLGNKFVGWNIIRKRHHVTNHWHCSRFDEQYFTFSWSSEKHIKTSYYNQLTQTIIILTHKVNRCK